MPDWSSKLDRAGRFRPLLRVHPIILVILFSFLCLTGCTDRVADERFELLGVDSRWSNGKLDLRFDQRLRLSGEAREALIHGVPLTIDIEVTLRHTGNQVRVAEGLRQYEIRYLPLSDHYQLTGDGAETVKTFPRLRHVLSDLSDLRMTLPTGVLPSGTYEVLARTRLNQESMPPPMRLPVLLSASWHHDTSWSSWPLELQPGA